MKDDPLELGEPLVERLRGFVFGVRQRREVGLPEVARVGEAGAHDAPVAGRDRRAAVRGDEVGDEDELVGQTSASGVVMAVPGLDPGIVRAIYGVPGRGLRRDAPSGAPWMAGSRPAMTAEGG